MEYVRRYWHIIMAVVCVAVLGAVYMRRNAAAPAVHTAEREVLVAAPEYVPATESVMQDAVTDIVVHIAGAVKAPGVFTLQYGSRVNDVLTLAGGPTEEADLARVNLAAFLADEQQIIIPKYGQEIAVYTPAADTAVASGLVNINTADAAELRTLPGVGEVIAGNIIAHREANGPFTSVDQLINVPRIGTVILENLRPLVTVD